jgi:hypothetical protein
LQDIQETALLTGESSSRVAPAGSGITGGLSALFFGNTRRKAKSTMDAAGRRFRVNIDAAPVEDNISLDDDLGNRRAMEMEENDAGDEQQPAAVHVDHHASRRHVRKHGVCGVYFCLVIFKVFYYFNFILWKNSLYEKNVVGTVIISVIKRNILCSYFLLTEKRLKCFCAILFRLGETCLYFIVERSNIVANSCFIPSSFID